KRPPMVRRAGCIHAGATTATPDDGFRPCQNGMVAGMTQPRPVALITGAARRIGAAVATALHAAGYDLALHYRESATEAAALQDALEEKRRNSTVLLRADLSDIERLPALVERTVLRFGRLDALVNNASAFFP